MRRNLRNAFTLIELITVMAVSSILLGLVMIPVFQAFQLTRASQGFADAQQTARVLVARIEREVSNAALVRPIDGPGGSIDIWLPNNAGVWTQIRLPQSKLDLVKPAQGDPSQRGQGGGFNNPDTGKEDPTLAGPTGQIDAPSAPGTSMTRYWIGLRNPLANYNNPYVFLKTTTLGNYSLSTGGRDNLFVLYRAEVQTKVWDPVQQRMVGNTRYFEVDGNQEPILDDPSFFTVQPGVAPAAAKLNRINNWLSAARIQTQTSRFDMIQLQFDKGNKSIAVDVGGVPRVQSLVRFQPATRSENLRASNAVNPGLETENGIKVGPQSYVASMPGIRARQFIQSLSTMPSQFVSTDWGHGAGQTLPGLPRAPYAGAARPFAQRNAAGDLELFAGNGFLMGNIDTYHRLRREQKSPGSPPPFLNAFNNGAGIDFAPFWIDEKSGRVNTDFDIREVGLNPATAYSSRIPTSASNANSGRLGVHVGPDVPFQADLLSADFAGFLEEDWDQPNFGINRRFNKLYATLAAAFPNIAGAREQFAKRFIDLRMIPQPDGTPSPLDLSAGGLNRQFVRASIVPGSETIIGPDQKPGPNYGRFVRYARTTQRPVGPNQYYINYVHLPEPNWANFGIAGVNYSPRTAMNTTFERVLQAQYRAGYVEFNSRPGEPIPDQDLAGNAMGNIFITYRFQFFEPADVMSVEFDSGKAMEILLTVQNYPATSGPTPGPTPQSVTIKGSAAVRNYLR